MSLVEEEPGFKNKRPRGPWEFRPKSKGEPCGFPASHGFDRLSAEMLTESRDPWKYSPHQWNWPHLRRSAAPDLFVFLAHHGMCSTIPLVSNKQHGKRLKPLKCRSSRDLPQKKTSQDRWLVEERCEKPWFHLGFFEKHQDGAPHSDNDIAGLVHFYMWHSKDPNCAFHMWVGTWLFW